MVQHCKSSDASNSDMPKRNCKVLPLREKVKLLDLTGKKKLYVEGAKIHCKNESSVHESRKKEREICVNFAVISQNAKVMAAVCDST